MRIKLFEIGILAAFVCSVAIVNSPVRGENHRGQVKRSTCLAVLSLVSLFNTSFFRLESSKSLAWKSITIRHATADEGHLPKLPRDLLLGEKAVLVLNESQLRAMVSFPNWGAKADDGNCVGISCVNERILPHIRFIGGKHTELSAVEDQIKSALEGNVVSIPGYDSPQAFMREMGATFNGGNPLKVVIQEAQLRLNPISPYILSPTLFAETRNKLQTTFSLSLVWKEKPSKDSLTKLVNEFPREPAAGWTQREWYRIKESIIQARSDFENLQLQSAGRWESPLEWMRNYDYISAMMSSRMDTLSETEMNTADRRWLKEQIDLGLPVPIGVKSKGNWGSHRLTVVGYYLNSEQTAPSEFIVLDPNHPQVLRSAIKWLKNPPVSNWDNDPENEQYGWYYDPKEIALSSPHNAISVWLTYFETSTDRLKALYGNTFAPYEIHSKKDRTFPAAR